jgi:hypothetical protein
MILYLKFDARQVGLSSAAHYAAMLSGGMSVHGTPHIQDPLWEPDTGFLFELA